MSIQPWPILTIALLLTACDTGPFNPDTEMYVRVQLQDAEKFTVSLAALLEEEGLNASVGRTTEPFPSTNHVLEGTNWSVRVWAQNAVLDPEPGKACGYDPPFSAVEQTQYVIAVNRRHPLAERQAKQTFVRLWNALAQRGYTVAHRQMPCLPLPKRSQT